MSEFFSIHHLTVCAIWFGCGVLCGRMWWYRHPAIHWNPGNKVVQDHRDGTVHVKATNWERKARGLPVPWTRAMSVAECLTRDIE